MSTLKVDFLPKKATLSVAEAAELLGVSRWALYQAIKVGQSPMPVIRVGSRILIATSHMRELLAVEE